VLTTNEGSQLQRCKEHFQEILKAHSGQIQPDSNQDSNPIKAIPSKPPIKAEIIMAIQELNKGKAPGRDNMFQKH
jgi:hypothetical protein